MKFSDRLKGLREKNDMTQEQLAKVSGVSPRTIQRSTKTQEAESCALVVAFNSISSPKCVKGSQQAFGC